MYVGTLGHCCVPHPYLGICQRVLTAAAPVFADVQHAGKFAMGLQKV